MGPYPREVYAIMHNKTKKIYVGSSANVEVRYRNHISTLRRGTHISKDMQKDFNKYGEDFSLFILDTIKDESENHKEIDWMLKYRSTDKQFGYNRDNKQRRITVPMKNGLPEVANITKED